MQVSLKELFSVPNILSFIRLLLIPIFISLYINATDEKDYYIASLIILLSGLTDLFDGFIARTFNQITEIGKALDPIADKLTQAAIAFCLTIKYHFIWILITLFVIKELYMGINGLILLRRGKKLDGAQWFGKLSTFIFYVTMLFLVAFPGIEPTIAQLLMGITFIFLLLSFILYIPEYNRLYRN
ncbi:CDP-alcohol phosphatidyltransferase family protein [Fervidibacillus albus]|uniref:CDP-diacylglycerol--glycerol-3-phosphate 3-phosphatidyltransferase n=1 Tax=Fervidibacillus albus TaxID=2980026 RepID=A0A9E8LYB7_9BACI|nr:CDP-alcohol phosphatidyltransferase family protein [Fervidibacillus albus]WAA11004.1 CDP-alcohol phosphatidyltransferase family protein [Fervidibacillus albus]